MSKKNGRYVAKHRRHILATSSSISDGNLQAITPLLFARVRFAIFTGFCTRRIDYDIGEQRRKCRNRQRRQGMLPLPSVLFLLHLIDAARKFHDSSIAALNEKMTGDRRTAACGRKAWPSIPHIGSKADHRVRLGNHFYAFLLL